MGSAPEGSYISYFSKISGTDNVRLEKVQIQKVFYQKEELQIKRCLFQFSVQLWKNFILMAKNFDQDISRECLVPRDVYKAIGYEEKNVNNAIQNLVPYKYRLRFGDVKLSLNQGEGVFLPHKDTVLLKEPGLYLKGTNFCDLREFWSISRN